MKNLIIALSLALSLSSFASTTPGVATVVCAMKDAKNPKNYVRIKAPTNQLGDYFISDVLRIGDDGFTFNVLLTLTGQKLQIDLTIDETRHVQDEVASASFEVDLKNAVPGKAILIEPLKMPTRIMDFVCYYNQPSQCGEKLDKKKKR